MSAVERQMSEAIAAAAGAVDAPQRLREAVGAQLRRHDAARRRRAARRRIGGAVAACAATALAVVLAFAHQTASPHPATIADAAALALRAPTLPAPARDARAPASLRASAGGVAFPDYTYGNLGWRAAGERRARQGGRDVVAVSYAQDGGRRVGYAIVGGTALPVPGGGSRVVRDGVRYAVLRRAGATVVTWRRGGRTCVLASRQAPADVLLRLAAWRGGERAGATAGAARGGGRY